MLKGNLSPGVLKLTGVLKQLGIVSLFLSLLIFTGLVPPRPAVAASIADQYDEAKTFYLSLKKNPDKAKYRDNWLKGIQMFQRIFSEHADHELAAPSLFMTGEMYADLFGWSDTPLDLGFAVSYLEDVSTHFPRHRLADDALYKIGLIYLNQQKNKDEAAKAFARVVAIYPNGDMADEAASQLKALKKIKVAGTPLQEKEKTPTLPADEERCSIPGKSTIKPIKYWSNDDYTRVVIETTAPVNFKENLLAASGDLPRRLYVDLESCCIGSNIQRNVPIQDGLLRQVRTAQFSPKTVRVVLDTQTFSDYKIFSLHDPFRIVIDVKGEKQPAKVLTAMKTKPTSVTAPTLPQQLGLGVRRIVLDPGHGGKDPGAIGPSGLKEKHIVLKVAQKVAHKLKQKHNCEIIFTRDRDIFVPLEERTAIANSKNGDLFVSIHANAARDSRAKGIETYLLDLATSNDAMLVAARENSTSAQQLGNLQTILADLLQKNKVTESVKLAEYVQDNMVSGLGSRYRNITDLGVKKAPFIVLIGAQMPAILTEISFISNPVESKRLKDDSYLDAIAEQLVAGISQYVFDLNVASLKLY